MRVPRQTLGPDHLHCVRRTINSRQPRTTFGSALWQRAENDHRVRDARRARSWRHVTSEEAGPGGNFTRLPRPVSSWRATALAWTGALFGRSPSVSHHLPSLGRLPLRGWSGRPSSSRSPLFGDRQSAALPDWSFCGAQGNGKTATLVPSRVVFCPQALAGHFGRLVGTATPLRVYRRPGACSRLSSPIPGPRGSRGHTCRTLPRAGSVSASRSW